MPLRLNSKEKLYFERSKSTAKITHLDTAGSFSKVYWAILPFLVLELLAEWKLSLPLGGAFFPLGYLFFWAIFFTYYEPKNLEKKFIFYENNFSLGRALPLLITALIWFVRFIIFDSFHFLFFGKKRTHFRRARAVKVRVIHQLEKPKPSLPYDLVESLHQLGLSVEAAKEWSLVQRRYRELAKKFHPDLNPAITQTGNRFMKIDRAYKKLEAYRDTYFK